MPHFPDLGIWFVVVFLVVVPGVAQPIVMCVWGSGMVVAVRVPVVIGVMFGESVVWPLCVAPLFVPGVVIRAVSVVCAGKKHLFISDRWVFAL